MAVAPQKTTRAGVPGRYTNTGKHRRRHSVRRQNLFHDHVSNRAPRMVNTRLEIVVNDAAMGESSSATTAVRAVKARLGAHRSACCERQEDAVIIECTTQVISSFGLQDSAVLLLAEDQSVARYQKVTKLNQHVALQTLRLRPTTNHRAMMRRRRSPQMEKLETMLKNTLPNLKQPWPDPPSLTTRSQRSSRSWVFCERQLPTDTTRAGESNTLFHTHTTMRKYHLSSFAQQPVPSESSADGGTANTEMPEFNQSDLSKNWAELSLTEPVKDVQLLDC